MPGKGARRLSREDTTSLAGDSTAKRAVSEHFSVVFGESESSEHSGCAIVVSKKIAKTSVGRHLLKRRVRAALKEWCQPSYAVIIYARAGAANLPYSIISDELSSLLPRVGASRTI